MPRCPECDERIDSDAINIREGAALCPACGQLTRLSELNYADRSIADIIDRPPAGCSVNSVADRVTVRASMRSVTGFLLPAGFALFWNGIVSIFVLIAIAGLYTNLVGPLPVWFPAPELDQGKPIMNGKPMGLGMTLFLCVFLIPFVTAGAGMVLVAFLNLVGKVEVVLGELNSYVATGVGPLVWKRRFDAAQVHAIKLDVSSWQHEGRTNHQIELQADRTVKFGMLLQPDRLEWLCVVLKELLVPSNVRRRSAALPTMPDRKFL